MVQQQASVHSKREAAAGVRYGQGLDRVFNTVLNIGGARIQNNISIMCETGKRRDAI